MCFATSRPANHAICSFIDSSGYASGLIRRCLFIDYIIIGYISIPQNSSWLSKPVFLKIRSQYKHILYYLILHETLLFIPFGPVASGRILVPF